MGNAPLSLGLQQGKPAAPFGGLHRHQPVVLPVKMADHRVGSIQGKSAVPGRPAPGHHALIHHARHIRCFRVPGQAGGFRQIRHRRQKVRIFVSQVLQRAVIGGSHLFPGRLRHLVQQVLRVDAAPVGRVDGGQCGYVGRHALMGNGGPGIQPAFGVGDDVHLFTAGLLHDGTDTVSQFPAAVLHRGGGLLLAVKHLGAVALQLSGDPAPVVQVFEIPEKHTVDQEDGIVRPADLAFRPDLIQLPLLRFKFRLPAGQADDLRQIPDVHTGDPPHQRRQDAGPDTQLHGGQIDPDHAVPEQHGLNQHSPQDPGDHSWQGDPVKTTGTPGQQKPHLCCRCHGCRDHKQPQKLTAAG